MKSPLLRLALILLWAASSAAQSVNISFTHKDNFGNLQTNRPDTLTPVSPLSGAFPIPLSRVPNYQVTDTNGVCTFSNVASGYIYTEVLSLPYGVQTNLIGIPPGSTGNVTNGYQWAGTNVGPYFAYLFLTNPIAAGTNVTITLVNGIYTISAGTNGGSGGISFTPTNGLNLTTNSGTTFLGLITNYNGTLTFTNATNQFGGSIVDPSGNTIFKDIGGITEIFPPGGSSAAAVTFSPAATVFNAPDNIVALEWLSGTNVFAPNQTATNASSVLTKGIADTLYAAIGSGGAASSNYLTLASGSATITNNLSAASFTGSATNPFTATNDVRAVKLTNAANILGGNGAALTGLPTNVFDLNIFSVTGTGVTMASGATPTNVSMQGTANGANTFYPTNMPNIGDAYRMANNAVGYSSWFFNGNANQQNIGQQNSDAELRFYNINPFQSGGGFAVTPTTTNAFGSALSTNTDGQKIYLQENDPHKYSILGVNSQDITNNIPGSLLFVANVGQATNDQIAFAAAKSVGGQSGNYSWIFMSMDANAVQYTHFPIHAAQAYAPTNSHWGVDALYIDHGLGRVGANNLYVTNLFFVNGSQWNSGASSNLINLALADPVQTLKISKIIPNGYTTAGALMFDAGNNGSGLFFPISDGNLHFANGAVDAGHLDGSSPPNWIFNSSGTFTNSVTTSNLTVTAGAVNGYVLYATNGGLAFWGTAPSGGGGTNFNVLSVTNVATIRDVEVTNRVVVQPATLAITGSNVVVDAAFSVYRLTLTTAVFFTNTINQVDGERMTWALQQDATGNRTCAFSTNYNFGTDITGITLTTNAGKIDYLTMFYNGPSNRWDVIGFVRGY